MAIVLGESSGFVIVAPTADPAGSNTTIDGSSVVTKHTSPEGANAITEIGWYRGAGTNTANFEIALYADSAGVAGARLFVDNTNSSNVQGWVITAVNWAISANTPYWLAVQMDAHSGSSSIDTATSGGAGSDVLTSQTTLADPYGGGAVADADGMYAIYAKVSVARNIAADVGALTLTGFSPTVVTTDNKNVSADLGVLTLIGFEPTASVSNNLNISADFGELNITGFEPTVSVTANLNLTPGFGDVQINGFAATVETPINLNADLGELTITGFEPSIQTPLNVLPGAGDVVLTGFEPTANATAHLNVHPDFGDMQIIAFEPTVETPLNIQPDTAIVLFEGFAPSVTTGDSIEIQVETGQLLITGFSPSVSASDNKNVEPNAGQITFTGFEPTVELPKNSQPAQGVLLITSFEPSVSVSDNITISANTGVITFTGYPPAVSIGNGEVNLAPQTGELDVSGFAPTVASLPVLVLVSPARTSLTLASVAASNVELTSNADNLRLGSKVISELNLKSHATV